MKLRATTPRCVDLLEKLNQGSKMMLIMMQFDSKLEVCMVFKLLWKKEDVKQGAKAKNCQEIGGLASSS